MAAVPNDCIAQRLRVLCCLNGRPSDVQRSDMDATLLRSLLSQTDLDQAVFSMTRPGTLIQTFGDSYPGNNNIFMGHIERLADHALSGGISALFVYGQPGSGRLSIAAAIRYLSSLVLTMRVTTLTGLAGRRTMGLSIVEVDGNEVHDLLEERVPVPVFEDESGEVIMEEVHEIDITSMVDFRTSWQVADQVRSVNKVILYRTRIMDEHGEKVGVHYIVELGHPGADLEYPFQARRRAMEALSYCVRVKLDAELNSDALPAQSQLPVPYQSSALTLLLKDVFVCVAPQGSNIVLVPCLDRTLDDMVSSRSILDFTYGLFRKPWPRVLTIEGNLMTNGYSSDSEHEMD